VTQPGYQAVSTCTVASPVTDNFGNRDNRRAGERQRKGKSESSLILGGRRDTQTMPIVSVTEVIEVIGYQLWRGRSGRISPGASESTAASTLRTGSGGTSGKPIKMMRLHWRSAGYLFARTMVLA
jgi:hypothetical protein